MRMHLKTSTLSFKVLLKMSNLNSHWNGSTIIRKILQYQI
jgi:hypothetical protein